MGDNEIVSMKSVTYNLLPVGARCSNCDFFIIGTVPHYCPSCALPVENFDNDVD